MKWISFPAVWIVFLLSLLRMGDAVEAAPKIAVDERVHFYGVQYLDEVRSVSHTFYLTNEGDEPLTITGTHPSCGCTRADLSG